MAGHCDHDRYLARAVCLKCKREVKREIHQETLEVLTDGGQPVVSDSAISREDIRVKTRGEHPALEIGDAEIILRTHFEGAPAEDVEVDHYDRHPFHVLDFDEEYFDGLLEIQPEFVPPKDGGSDD